MKRIVSSLLILAIILAISACGNGDSVRKDAVNVLSLNADSYLILEDRSGAVAAGDLISIIMPERTAVVPGGIYSVSLGPKMAAKYPPQVVAETVEAIDDGTSAPISFDTVAKIQAHLPDMTYLVDVRTESEFNEGHVPNAVSMPVETIQTEIKKSDIKQKDIIIVYCRSGRRSAMAASALKKLGYAVLLDAGGIMDYDGELER